MVTDCEHVCNENAALAADPGGAAAGALLEGPNWDLSRRVPACPPRMCWMPAHLDAP